MVSKQKSIFDKEPVKVRVQKEQTKTEDVVPFEESIFALNKKDKITDYSINLAPKEDFVPIEDTIFCQRSIIKDDNGEDSEDNLSHDDEVPLEESIFAKRKKSVLVLPKAFPKECKINLDDLFNKYKDLYMSEYISNVNRSNMIDANMFNNCCVILEESRKTKVMNVEAYDIVKKVIKSVCTCVGDVFYSYTNINIVLLSLISELYPDMDTFTMYKILDRSYIEVIDEFGGKHG